MPLFPKPTYSTVKPPARKTDIPKDLYTRCPASGELVYVKELEKNLMVVPKSGYHFPLSAPRRIASLIDEGTWTEHDSAIASQDILGFKDLKSYAERLETYQKKTGLKEGVVCGLGEMGGQRVSLAVMDSRFGMASMGSAMGEKITRAIERATAEKVPLIIVCASGGARMQEGIFSLMQMAKTSAALARHSKAQLPYIAVLTNPTTGGVSASFATLGDLILAEPQALIGFAGPRVIQEGTNEVLPEGFQRSEFLLSRGLVDQIVARGELRERLIYFLGVFAKKAA